MLATNDTPIPKTPTQLKPGDRLLRLKQVNEKIGTGGRTIYLWMKENRFPQCVPLYGGRVAWLESEVDAWMVERVASRKEA